VITWVHAMAASALPRHHSALDRMPFAQARCDGVRLASSDTKFAAYDIDLVG
jgi:PIN domain nuclease of toxin-antitoxin system